MTDLGLLDINDVFRYEASTEGTDNFTGFIRNRTGGVGDQVQSNPQQANRIRGLGAAGTSGFGVNTAFGSFATNNAIPFDPYNVAAIQVSRGSNSNLLAAAPRQARSTLCRPKRTRVGKVSAATCASTAMAAAARA